MSNPALIPIQFYSWKPLPLELRSTFELPDWPYSRQDNQLPPDVLEYFNTYGIWYYRDGLPGVNGARHALFGTYLGKPLSEAKFPIDVFGYSGYIRYADMSFAIGKWWPSCSREFIDQQIAISGDDYAWNVWGEQRRAKAFGRYSIAFEKKPKVGRLAKGFKSFEELPRARK